MGVVLTTWSEELPIFYFQNFFLFEKKKMFVWLPLMTALVMFLSPGTSSPIPQPAPKPLYLGNLVDLVQAKLGLKKAIIGSAVRTALGVKAAKLGLVKKVVDKKVGLVRKVVDKKVGLVKKAVDAKRNLWG